MNCVACKTKNNGEHFYCWKCGNRLGLQGWTMVGGNANRSSFVNIDDFHITEYRFSNITTHFPSILTGEKLILWDTEGYLKSFLFDELYKGSTIPQWEKKFDIDLKVYNSLSYAKSHIYLVSEGRIANININSGKIIFSEVKTSKDGSFINIVPTSTPLVTSLKDDIYIAFGLKGSVMIIHCNKFNRTTVKFEQLEDQSLFLRSPVRWQNKIIFVSSTGEWLTYDLESKELYRKHENIAKADIFSAPCIIDNSLFIECLSESGHFLIIFNLNDECSTSILISPNILDTNHIRFDFSPLGHPSYGAIVSDYSSRSLKVVSLDSRIISIPLNHEVDHYNSLVLGKYLYCASSDGIHKINLINKKDSTMPLNILEKMISPPLYFDSRIIFPLEKSLLMAKGSEK